MTDILDKLDDLAVNINGPLSFLARDAAAEIRRLRVDLQRKKEGLPSFNRLDISLEQIQNKIQEIKDIFQSTKGPHEVRMADDYFANSYVDKFDES